MDEGSGGDTTAAATMKGLPNLCKVHALDCCGFCDAELDTIYGRVQQQQSSFLVSSKLG
jgi:hypothetical protein